MVRRHAEVGEDAVERLYSPHTQLAAHETEIAFDEGKPVVMDAFGIGLRIGVLVERIEPAPAAELRKYQRGVAAASERQVGVTSLRSDVEQLDGFLCKNRYVVFVHRVCSVPVRIVSGRVSQALLSFCFIGLVCPVLSACPLPSFPGRSVCFGIGAAGFWRPISGLCGGTRILHRAPPAPADCAALLPFRCFWSAAALHRSFFVAANPVIMCALPVCRLLLEWWRGDWL